MIFAGEPYRWPPDVVRRQTVRDLRLLLMSHDNDEDDEGD